MKKEKLHRVTIVSKAGACTMVGTKREIAKRIYDAYMEHDVISITVVG